MKDTSRHSLDDRSQNRRAISHCVGSTGGHCGEMPSSSPCDRRVTPSKLIEEYDYAAGPPDLAGWTDIVELPFQAASGEVFFVDWDGQPFHKATVEPGEYRLRVHARGRDEGRARTYELTMDDEPVEVHMIQLFPSAGDQVVSKTEDQTGDISVARACRNPSPRGTGPHAPQAEFEEFVRSRDIILPLTQKMGLSGNGSWSTSLNEQIDARVKRLIADSKPL